MSSHEVREGVKGAASDIATGCLKWVVILVFAAAVAIVLVLLWNRAVSV